MAKKLYLVTFDNPGAKVFNIQRVLVAKTPQKAIGYIRSLLFSNIRAQEIKHGEYQDVSTIIVD